ncbi:MAG: protein translocase subunit SecD [Acidobacteria bacterium]|nr:protein translocase subunit SecD [Acidobacteriota bacterium]MYK88658.1 protein translocase subunit SecD [Acidobacteriota bacterium]
MQKNLQWKLLAIVAVTALAAWGVYPPGDQIRLGLDLSGGAHLVLRVETSDALQVETETAAEQLGEQMSLQGMEAATVIPVDATTIRVEGVPGERDGAFRQLSDERLAASYDREPGAGGAYTFRMRGPVNASLREEAVRQALQTIERRVNELGVSEPIVAPHGIGGDQILVQLPGVSDVARAKALIRSTSLLELKLVEEGPSPSREALLQARNGVVPPDMEIATQPSAAGTEPFYYLVRRVAAVTGRDLRNARPSLDEFNQPAVSFTLNREGAVKMGDITSANLGRGLAIILDGQVRSAPTIQGRITDSGQITGVSQQEAEDLQITLRSGALPASLTYLEERTVGPTLGADSIRAGVAASIAGLVLVAFFMLAYYKLAGINAVVAVVLNLLILMACMAYIEAVLTLPGIAGLILTIGIGVDSNVLIFERIKEELRSARSVRSAVAAGFDRVLLTIIDTHVASLIAAAFLFQFGSGPIKGFATTLFFGLVSNVFTAVFVSRSMFEAVLSRRRVATLSI